MITVIKQKVIYREDLRNNPNVLYIFGDNLERTGFGGQAKEMRGEPNAFGIPTKRKAAHGSNDCYLWDHEQDAWDAVNAHFNALYRAIDMGWDVIVVPTDGIGTGLARLSETAPKLLEFIKNQLDNLPNYV